MTPAAPALPLILVTGFLGVGKTTLLRRIAESAVDRRFVFLVNEFNPRDIDGALLRTERRDILLVPGGSIFCRCLVTEFMNRLRSIGADFPKTEAVIIEASGMADPRVLPRILQETNLDSCYYLKSVICVVDPKTLRKLRHTLPNILAQIKAADRIIVNKTDLAGENEINETLDLIHELNPDATVHTTTHCSVDDVLATPPARTRPEGDYAPCRDPDFATFTTPGTTAALEALKRILETDGDAVHRVKGFIEDNGTRRYLDYSGHAPRLAPAGDSETPCRLVWILRGADEVRIRGKLSRAGLFED